MRVIGKLIQRNIKLFFKDKGMFFTALITPIMLLVLYVTFLYNVYEDSFTSSVPAEFVFEEGIIDGLVGGLLLSSLLAVSGVTVAFSSNLSMIADKASGARGDFSIAPVKPSALAIGYYVAALINGLIISLVAAALGMVYLAFAGWYLSFADVLLLLLDVFLLATFGTALSSVICYPLTTQGQLSAVGAIVSAGYGFICGAYMPISSFSEGLKNVLSCFPGTYATSLLRNHALGGVTEEMIAQGFPQEVVDGILSTADCTPTFFGYSVEIWQMYLVLGASILLLLGVYILLNVLHGKKQTREKKVKN